MHTYNPSSQQDLCLTRQNGGGPGRPPWVVSQELLQGQNVAQTGLELDLNRNKGFFFASLKAHGGLSPIYLCVFKFRVTVLNSRPLSCSSFVSFYLWSSRQCAGLEQWSYWSGASYLKFGSTNLYVAEATCTMCWGK